MWMYDLAREQAPNLSHLRRIFQLTRGAGYTHIGLYLEHRFAYPSAPWAHGAQCLTPDMVRTLRSEFPDLQIVPFLNLLGHFKGMFQTERGKRFAEERMKGLQACPSNPEFVELASRLLDDALEIFDSEIIHIGGDETYQLGRCPRCAEVVARKLSQALEAPIELDGTSVRMGASIGVAIFPDDGDDLDTLLRHADTAMYAAKAAGRNQWRFFEPSMHAGVSRRLTLETALRAALANPDGAGLHLHYQPQVRAEDGRVVGVEALLRWRHPELGPLSPAEFVRVAEEAGIVDRLDHWVLQHSLAQWAQWCAQAPALLQDVRLALNVSAQELVHGTLLERVRTALATHGLGADVLEIEITESSLFESLGLAQTIVASLPESENVAYRLLQEYQKDTYSPYPADAAAAQQSARLMWKLAFQKRGKMILAKLRGRPLESGI